jgi:hypothetical protein
MFHKTGHVLIDNCGSLTNIRFFIFNFSYKKYKKILYHIIL